MSLSRTGARQEDLWDITHPAGIVTGGDARTSDVACDIRYVRLGRRLARGMRVWAREDQPGHASELARVIAGVFLVQAGA